LIVTGWSLAKQKPWRAGKLASSTREAQQSSMKPCRFGRKREARFVRFRSALLEKCDAGRGTQPDIVSAYAHSLLKTQSKPGMQA